MKKCQDCKRISSSTNFHVDKRAKDGKSGRCKKCQNTRTRHYGCVMRDRWRTFMNVIIAPVCSTCGYSKSQRALDYHHLNPTEKSFNISKFVWKRGLTPKNKQLMEEELSKCVVLCANCHRELHEEDDLKKRK